jgi:hypothetical protein
MSVEQLIGNLVYADGSELWVVPDKSSSQWARTLDWYLNFQISKANAFKRSEMSDGLQDIIREEEVESIEIPNQEGKPLLIASPKHLPNLMTVVLAFDEAHKQEWLDAIEKTWLELGKPRTRVFLPRALPENTFTDFSKKRLNGEITFVVDK